MNILTFDIEEWYIEKAYRGGHAERYHLFDTYLNRILDLLERQGVKATFFCVGKLATDFPQVVKLIATKGHEVGCHSHTHLWLNKMSRQEALDDTRAAVDALEQCIGKKVISYRAPAFSIGENNKWAFEVLAESGIERDASVFPASRDFGGFPQFTSHEPTLVTYQGITLKEFPIPTTKLFGKELAYSGGGYFRFFPLWFIRSRMKDNAYNMCYFHIGDLLEGAKKVHTKAEYEEYYREPGTLLNRYKRYIKSSLGRHGVFEKMEQLISSDVFMGLDEADKMIKWDKEPNGLINSVRNS